MVTGTAQRFKLHVAKNLRLRRGARVYQNGEYSAPAETASVHFKVRWVEYSEFQTHLSDEGRMERPARHMETPRFMGQREALPAAQSMTAPAPTPATQSAAPPLYVASRKSTF